MNKKEAKERINKLKHEINRYRYAYHVQDKSLISEEALDSLKKELFDLESIYPDLVTPDSPTQRVAGEPLEGFKKVQHEEPMLSFNDAFSEEDMRDWLSRIERYLNKGLSETSFYGELKIDGLAIELVYENGSLAQGSTRGDGNIGEDVTQNLKTIDAIPLKISSDERLVVRGEVFIPQTEFERVNKERKNRQEKAFANPRNMAAGSIRQLNPKVTASRKLDSFAYDIVGSNYETHDQKHEMLHKLGFKVNPHNKVLKSFNEIIKFRNYWDKNRKKLDYEIDGVVVIINDETLFNRAGVVGKASRAAIAYKFSPQEATAKVLDIKVQVGRTGALTPVAVLTPTEVGGVTITHATLHNYDEIKRLDLKIGDTVIVNRAGDVIPKIIKVLPELRTGDEKDFKMPKKCPVDGSEVVRDGVIYKCSNRNCGARLREALYHFVSRQAYNIRGLGEKIIDKFLDEGLISDAADIFTLQEGDIAALEGFGEKSAENIVEEVESKKEVSLARFIYALGITHVGEETANLLAKQVNSKLKKSELSIQKFIYVLKSQDLEDLQEIPDVGPKVAESISNWFEDEKNIELLEKLDDVGIKVFMKEEKIDKTSPIYDKKFVITGTLDQVSRDEAKNIIRRKGGDVSGSVSSKTDYVVAGENPGSKLKNAKELGVKVINEEEFMKMVKE